MTKFFAVALGWIIICLVTAQAQDEPGMDVTVQRVLSQYGMDSKILRPYAQVHDPSSREDGRFLLRFEGTPGIEALLDRNYWVLVGWSAKKENDTLAYMLNPADGQSALNVSVGDSLHDKPDAELKKAAGFTKITPHPGQVGGRKMVWRRWSDQEHLYSDCTLSLPAGGSERKVNILVTANTTQRRKALEDAMASLKLLAAKE